MKKLLSVLALLTMVFTGTVALAGHGHYVDGVEGIKAGSVPPEGFYWRMYNVFYNADKLKDKHGKNAGPDFDVSVYAMANRFVYSSPIQILGGNLAFDVTIPLVYTDVAIDFGHGMSMSDNRFGLGDILVEPFILAWHGAQWDAAVAAGVYLPVGYYKPSKMASPGKGYWTALLTAGGTFYFDAEKSWHISALSRYEIHTEQDKTHITPGNDFHIEWGLGKTLAKIWDVGVAGYCHWQTTKDSGPGASSDLMQTYAVGPEVSVFIPDWGVGISLRSLWEFESRSTTQGNTTTLMLMKVF